MDIIKLDDDRSELYDELIKMSLDDNYDIDEIEEIISDIDDIERKVLLHRKKTSKLLRRFLNVH